MNLSMKQVWKFPLLVQDEVTIEMPKGAELLEVDVQNGQPQLWALVNPAAKTALRHFRVAGTGHPITGRVSHVGSFILRGGTLVFHVFEVSTS